jgi:hypothetical protein
MEEVASKGSGPGPHKHTWSDETYYIMDGEITFLVGDEIKTARTGDYVMVPRNTRHAFRVESETVRFLNGYTPASLEAYVVEWAMPATERVVPPKGVSPTMAFLATNPELLSRYGMDILPGPDPLRPDDLFAPYRKTERKNHEALCQVLTEHFAIPISLRDFANGWDEDDPGYWINPLQFAHITGGNKLVIVTCCYVLEKPTKEKSPLVFTIDPATVEFHLLESAPESVS